MNKKLKRILSAAAIAAAVTAVGATSAFAAGTGTVRNQPGNRTVFQYGSAVMYDSSEKLCGYRGHLSDCVFEICPQFRDI